MAQKKNSKRPAAVRQDLVSGRGVSADRSLPTAPPAALPRDTPRDTPAVGATPAESEVLARLRGMETLEEAYQAYAEAKLEHAAGARAIAEQLKRLEDEGRFLLGAVRAAHVNEPPSSGPDELAAPDALAGYLGEAEARLSSARRDLEAQAEELEARFARLFAELEQEISDRVVRYGARLLPKLTLFLRPAGKGRILHVARVGRDEAVVLFSLLSGKLPTRYGFLFDDSTEDVSLPPPNLYAEGGVTEVRPGADAFEAWLSGGARLVPFKGFLPVRLPLHGGGSQLFRLLQRGAVMEAEVRDGEGFRSLLTHEESERLAGHLLQLRLAGKLSLEVKSG